MRKTIDRILIGLLAFGALGHLFGTFALTSVGGELFVWSLAGVMAAALTVAVNVLRHVRPDDKPVARIALVSSVCWAVIAILFGVSIENILDPRVLIHAVAGAGLGIISFSTLRGA